MKSERLEAKQKHDAALAEAELQANMRQIEMFVLPSGQESENEQTAADLHAVHQRIQNIIRTLNNFKELGDHER